MQIKAYIINFEKGGFLDNFDYKKFHNSLTTTDGVMSWWHYLETTYIIITQPNVYASNVGEYVRKIAPKKKIFICELNLANHDGWLPQEAWDWIMKFR